MHYVRQYLIDRSTLPILSLISVLSIPDPTAARLVNITVDDQNPDPLTGNSFTYSPSNEWNIGNGCQPCAVKLDPSKTFDATWHDATFRVSTSGSEVQTASLQFTGKHSFCEFSYRFSLDTFPVLRLGDLCIWDPLPS